MVRYDYLNHGFLLGGKIMEIKRSDGETCALIKYIKEHKARITTGIFIIIIGFLLYLGVIFGVVLFGNTDFGQSVQMAFGTACEICGATLF